jgi:hypothetical protein
MTEIIPAMSAGEFARGDRAKAEIADPKHFPEISFAFQLCCFRELSSIAKEFKKVSIFQLSRSPLDDKIVPIPCLTQKTFDEIKENAVEGHLDPFRWRLGPGPYKKRADAWSVEWPRSWTRNCVRDSKQ